MSATPKRPTPTLTRRATSWAIRLFDEMNALDLPLKREIVLLMGQMLTNELSRAPQLLASVAATQPASPPLPPIEDETT